MFSSSTEEPFSPLSIATSINAVPPSTTLLSNEPSNISVASSLATKIGKDDGSTQVGQLSIGPGILGYGTAGSEPHLTIKHCSCSRVVT